MKQKSQDTKIAEAYGMIQAIITWWDIGKIDGEQAMRLIMNICWNSNMVDWDEVSKGAERRYANQSAAEQAELKRWV